MLVELPVKMTNLVPSEAVEIRQRSSDKQPFLCREVEVISHSEPTKLKIKTPKVHQRNLHWQREESCVHIREVSLSK